MSSRTAFFKTILINANNPPFKNYVLRFSSVSSLAIVFCIQPTPNSVTILTMVKSAFTAEGFSLVPKCIMMVRREYNAAFGWGYDPCNHKYKVERIVNRSGEIEGVHPSTVIGSASNYSLSFFQCKHVKLRLELFIGWAKQRKETQKSLSLNLYDNTFHEIQSPCCKLHCNCYLDAFGGSLPVVCGRDPNQIDM
jgi:hypothetical protein